MKKAVFLGTRGYDSIDAVYTPELKLALSRRVDLYPERIDRDNLKEHEPFLRQAEVAFSTWGMPAFSEEEIGRFMPNLRAVFYAAGSVHGFARPFLRRGVIVVSAWMANAVPVAEFTAALIVLANKGFFQAASLCKSDWHEARRFSLAHPGNFDAKVGILGAGSVGKQVIRRLKDHRLDIWVFDPFLPDGQARELGVKKTDLADIFAHCHTISNHLANVPETAGMLNGEHFHRMLPYATFINTGRGAQVVERDLIDALRSVPTRTAVLDVTDPEPVRPDSELLNLPNVFLTPHIAGSQSRELARLAECMIEEFDRYERGEPLRYRVTPDMLNRMSV